MARTYERAVGFQRDVFTQRGRRCQIDAERGLFAHSGGHSGGGVGKRDAIFGDFVRGSSPFAAALVETLFPAQLNLTATRQVERDA